MLLIQIWSHYYYYIWNVQYLLDCKALFFNLFAYFLCLESFGPFTACLSCHNLPYFICRCKANNCTNANTETL